MNTGPDNAEAQVERQFELEEPGRGNPRWRLRVRAADLALYEGDDPQPFVFLRGQVQKDVLFIEGMRVLAVTRPRKVTLKLPDEAVRAVADWIGEPTLALFHLKRRYSWVLPVAVIWIVGSLPLPGDPDAGVEAVPLDWIGMVLGGALLVSWAFARWRPHPVLFLVDSIWFLCLAAYLIHDVWNGRSRLWMILVGLLLWMAITGFRHFARFKGTRLPPSSR